MMMLHLNRPLLKQEKEGEEDKFEEIG